MELPLEQYVLVNASWQRYVLPGEEAHTFTDLTELLYEAIELINEYGHILGDSIRVYRLVEVPMEELERYLPEARKQWEADNGWRVDDE